MFPVCCNCCIKSYIYIYIYIYIEHNSERILNIEPFIDQYNWEGIDFPMHQNGQEKCEEPKNIMEIDWKKFEQNNKATALNMLHVPHNK